MVQLLSALIALLVRTKGLIIKKSKKSNRTAMKPECVDYYFVVAVLDSNLISFIMKEKNIRKKYMHFSRKETIFRCYFLILICK